MLIALIIISLIFVGVGFLLNTENADSLLSGYNSMSVEEKENFDINSFVPYFRKVHLILGGTLLIIGLLLYYLINPEWTGVFMSTYPLIAYCFLIWKTNKFYKVPNKKDRVKSFVVMVFILAVFVAIGGMFIYSLQENQVIVEKEMIKFTGDYGREIEKSKIKSISLVDTLPNIKVKTTGFSLQKIKKGAYKTEDGEEITLLINSDKKPIVLIEEINGHKIYYSAKERPNQKVFVELIKGIK
ncbi:DUF3784 domain-containing protein [Sphingobacterium cellulitidis]|uniref:DUF3784 domain-containing protein n=1 Tax=Sphingobacterium cellulitidis TaxID=1768011 RepID=UPI00370D8CAD